MKIKRLAPQLKYATIFRRPNPALTNLNPSPLTKCPALYQDEDKPDNKIQRLPENSQSKRLMQYTAVDISYSARCNIC
ncbi:unnamed protein product [Onchocerca ochengi]|uniref:Ovule protein n=1 Tax=Onchocerca ochengi TaxID=42157 RepID=A0A182ED59_ONCOC|nr:unnamed protein product [Onchocerca ochengi]